MYTLRLFKKRNEVNRTQIYLGSVFTVKYAEDADKELGIKFRVTGNSESVPNDGLAVYKNDYAFIMTESGRTFETLNKPIPRIAEENQKPTALKELPKEEYEKICLSQMDDMCKESLEPDSYVAWEKIVAELKMNRQAFKD